MYVFKCMVNIFYRFLYNIFVNVVISIFWKFFVIKILKIDLSIELI